MDCRISTETLRGLVGAEGPSSRWTHIWVTQMSYVMVDERDMQQEVRWYYEKRANHCVAALLRNNINACYVSDRNEARAKCFELMEGCTTVGEGYCRRRGTGTASCERNRWCLVWIGWFVNVIYPKREPFRFIVWFWRHNPKGIIAWSFFLSSR